MLSVAKTEQKLFMEAMWTRFIPAITQVRSWLQEGIIGDVRMVQGNFGFRGHNDPEDRWLNLQLGGGSLLDVGIYVVSLASMVFGEPPEKITSQAHIGETGADEQVAMVLGYRNGALAQLSCAVQTQLPGHVTICGTRGRIVIHEPFWCATSITLSVDDQEDMHINLPLRKNGYEYEAEAAMDCLRAGQLECDIMPHEESLQIMQTLDKIRAQFGLIYPTERN
jgi:predicted dehydrogenase